MVALLAVGLVLCYPHPAPAFFAAENTCLSKLGKAVAKVNKIAFKAGSKCLDKEIAGKGTLPCPSLTDAAKIQQTLDKAVVLAASACGSTCSVSQVPCITSRLCPPNGTLPELCTGGIKGIRFDIDNLGFPGPICESPAVLGRQLETAADLGECAGKVALLTTESALAAVYGGVSSATIAGPAAGKCLATAAKAFAKLVGTAAKGILKCRDRVNKGVLQINPADCATSDVKLAGKIAKIEDKLARLIGTKCTNNDISGLEICNGTATTVAEAIACLSAGAREVAESKLQSADRTFSSASLVEAAYPAAPSCGDGVVNQVQNAFLLLGEECDGDDDAACPGECGAPGDVFECSCLNIPRVRFFGDPDQSDLDSGWTGVSYNSNVPENSGYFSRRENCDCAAFAPLLKCDGDRSTVCTSNADCELAGAGACTVRSTQCVGTSIDPICDVPATLLPVCAFNPTSTVSCDQFGNHNGSHTDTDCTYCDAFNANPFDSCDDAGDCQAQCYDEADAIVGSCTKQSDCDALGANLRCRGQCLPSECLVIPSAAPIPQSGGTPTCLESIFVNDVTGTQNILDGTGQTFLEQNTKVFLGMSSTVPCPVCGGFCAGGTRAGEICQGSCSGSGDDCRFDSDCGPGETCTTASTGCPDSTCTLSLICGGAGLGGANAGQACRIQAFTEKFGSVSNDCQPNNNISGNGLSIKFTPQTTGTVALADTLACGAPGKENYDCPCPGLTGALTAPNKCATACDAGPSFGQGCGTGTDSNGGFATTCAAGATNAGENCDADADCAGDTCSNNPTHCEGNPATDLQLCATNGDCGLGGTCTDACPGGRCVPLCLPSNDPHFGALAGSDPADGFCAGGSPRYHCSGAKFDFLSCTAGDAAAGCSATCSVSATPCNDSSQCPAGENCAGECPAARLCGAGSDSTLGNANDQPGAGICVEDPRHCAVSDVTKTCTILPGDAPGSAQQPCSVDTDCTDFPARLCDGPAATFSAVGIPDVSNPTNVSVYCVRPTNSPTVNLSSGLGGPSRLRQGGISVPNYDCLGVGCP